MIDNRTVGKRIAALRQENGLTQQQLAAMMSVSHQAVSKWEGGQALPDIQTMLELTRFFGLTVEQLISGADETVAEGMPAPEILPPEEEEETIDTVQEVHQMNIQQLLQMAPFMAKETVEEIVMGIEEKLSANQIARIAPYLRPECVEALIEKHKPELSWDTLRRIAPHMRRESVDELARAVAAGKETIKPAPDSFNKAINDIGKAFDDIGKGIDRAVQKAVRFGENVINEVSSAISDLSDVAQTATESPARSERAKAIRQKAFERALKDGRWDWIAEHLGELDADSELKYRIAARAKEMGMHDWICKHMGGYADEFTIEAAIAAGNWSWLGENVWRFEDTMQQKVALAAMRAENWQWLGRYSDPLNLDGCAMEIIRTALSKGAKVLAAQLASLHLEKEQLDELAQEIYASGDLEALELLANSAVPDSLNGLLVQLAEKQDWEHVHKYVSGAGSETIERLMEIAVDQGNFDSVDLLDGLL